MVGNSKHQCKFRRDDEGKPIIENGKKVLMCKVGDEGPVVAHPTKEGKYNFVPEGEVSSNKEGEIIKYMKVRLGVDTEGKSGEW